MRAPPLLPTGWLSAGALAALVALAPGSDALAGGPPPPEVSGSREPLPLRLLAGPRALPLPGPRAVLLRRATVSLGSTPEEILDATAECARSPYGHLCRTDSPFAIESPVFRVSLPAMLVDRVEVTQGEWERCVARGRCPTLPLDEGAARFRARDLPVTFVTWEEAKAYCAQRGARLPTEAEWERAARGTSRRPYPWGRRFHGKAANHGRLGWDPLDGRDGFRELAPAGSFPTGRTPEGLLDLAGNAAEWVDGRLLPYPGAPPLPPGAPPPGPVVRGGDYASAPAWLRGAARREASPTIRRPTLGFRCVRDVEGR